jgi:hypothetical protein
MSVASLVRGLEDEAITIIREVTAECPSPVLAAKTPPCFSTPR